MQLRFKTRDHRAVGLRDWALDRTGFALRRLTWRVSHASVRMADVDGPRHGVDKQCQVSIVAVDGSPVVVTATARDWHSAFNQALARAVDGLKRSLHRGQATRRAERRFVRGLRAPGPNPA